MSVQTGVVRSITLTDDDLSPTPDIDIYSVQVLLSGMAGAAVSAYPLDINIRKVPLLGETVIVFSSIGPETKSGGVNVRYFFLPVSLQLNPNNNALPNSNVPQQSDSGGGTADGMSSIALGNPTADNADDTEHDLGEGFTEDSTISPLQPFLGDVLIEGRFGHSLRFGYTPTTSETTKNPSWSAGGGDTDPVTILSNGRPSGDNNKFIIEDADDDMSSIWLTSTQQVTVDTDLKLATGVDEQNAFSSPSVIITSDRILLNSRKDYIILSGGSSGNEGGVNISTPSWKMDMDKLFTIIEGLAQQLTDLTSGKSTYATAVGPTGPASNMADVQQLLQDLQQMQQ
jgi:hypothetical protein